MNKIQFSKTEVIKKGWGREEVITNNFNYCGKLLVYEQVGAVSSRHFHLNKEEHFYCVSLYIFVNYIMRINILFYQWASRVITNFCYPCKIKL
jgi:hypothetical protein